MQHRFLVLTALVCAANSYGADSSSSSSVSLEGTVYAFHNPTGDVTLHVDTRNIDRKKLVLQMAQGQVVSSHLKLEDNFLYYEHTDDVVDRLYGPGPISVCVAGGYPKGDTNRAEYEYKRAKRFFILNRCISSHGQKTFDGHVEIQKLENLAAVVNAIKHMQDAAIVIDLKEWLNVAYGAKQVELPVRMVPQWVSGVCHADFTEYEPRALTQAQLDERQGRDEARLATPVMQWFKELFTLDRD